MKTIEQDVMTLCALKSIKENFSNKNKQAVHVILIQTVSFLLDL